MPAKHPTSPTWRRIEAVPRGAPWQHLGQVANDRLRMLRASGIRISQEALSSDGGPSGAWFRRMCNTGQPLAAPFVTGIEKALHWPEGHALMILNGGNDETPLPAQDDTLTITFPPGVLPDDDNDREDVRIAAYRAASARVADLRRNPT